MTDEVKQLLLDTFRIAFRLGESRAERAAFLTPSERSGSIRASADEIDHEAHEHVDGLYENDVVELTEVVEHLRLV